MKHIFRAGVRVYEVDIARHLVTIQDQEAKEKITIPREEFRHFLDWMTAEMKPARSVSKTQEVDVWDISATPKKSK